MKKRKDECLFCTSRTCNHRIYRREVPIFDEVSCNAHIGSLEIYADKILGVHNGVVRNHISGTRKYIRGEVYEFELDEAKR